MRMFLSLSSWSPVHQTQTAAPTAVRRRACRVSWPPPWPSSWPPARRRPGCAGLLFLLSFCLSLLLRVIWGVGVFIKLDKLPNLRVENLKGWKFGNWGKKSEQNTLFHFPSLFCTFLQLSLFSPLFPVLFLNSWLKKYPTSLVNFI